ncbi:hypothetical protein LOC68_25030 [Blastopirellula sp. JC732]|uniref:Uncharacterized protein n=1 Tax=Blastopirellula sediminis TaxID=2894196 RepID=A0A9X1MSD5_9BACT|nr:hypothetical protein [Blastopirellula sediminis]MCC9605026.1 hypothetical protein [Blastopirellula sediminis]MCC9631674.1 hypothetical protein [Blastopirellula sediminis]
MTTDEKFAAESPAPTPPRPSLMRFSLFTLMSATAVFAVWMAFFLTARETKRMELMLPSLRNLARELRVDVPSWYAAVRHQELSDDDFRWRVYLPPDHKYQLCLASRNFMTYMHPGEEKPAPSLVAPSAPGEHEVTLNYYKVEEEWIIQVSVDDQIVMQESQPADWNLGLGSSGGSKIDTNRQFSIEEPLELFDRVFSVPLPDQPNSSSTQRSETGLRLWVETLER